MTRLFRAVVPASIFAVSAISFYSALTDYQSKNPFENSLAVLRYAVVEKDISTLEEKKLEVAKSVPRISLPGFDADNRLKSYDSEREKIGEMTKRIDSLESELVSLEKQPDFKNHRSYSVDRAKGLMSDAFAGVYLAITGLLSLRVGKKLKR